MTEVDFDVWLEELRAEAQFADVRDSKVWDLARFIEAVPDDEREWALGVFTDAGHDFGDGEAAWWRLWLWAGRNRDEFLRIAREGGLA